MTTDVALVEWAKRFQGPGPSNPQRLRQKLQASLVPLVQCVLKTGLGQPHLVRWVRDHLPRLTQDQRREPAGPLAAELADRLMARIDPLPQRETVVNR